MLETDLYEHRAFEVLLEILSLSVSSSGKLFEIVVSSAH